MALNVADPSDVSRYWGVRGRAVSVTPDGAAEHIDRLAHEYLGGPYPWYGGRDQQRLVVSISPEKISSPQS